MNIPQDLLYTKDHEWVKIEGDTATVGISDYAQGELGDIVFIELPAVGDSTKQFEPCASIEAVKAVSDLYAPLSGEVTAVNSELDGDPQLVNKEPYQAGWILKINIADPAEKDKLLSSDKYKEMVG